MTPRKGPRRRPAKPAPPLGIFGKEEPMGQEAGELTKQSKRTSRRKRQRANRR